MIFHSRRSGAKDRIATQNILGARSMTGVLGIDEQESRISLESIRQRTGLLGSVPGTVEICPTSGQDSYLAS